VVIRTATTADLPELSAIKSAVSRRAYGALMTEEQLAWWLDVGCSQERFAPHLDDPGSTVLLDDETRAVGTITFAEAAYISDVYVERAGAGGGRRMVDALLSLARGRRLPQAECSVMGWSSDAMAFWRRMGFERGRFMTQPSFDRHGLMRRDGWMRSESFPTTYLGYVRAL
jgi:GNAT superfamily N-acetyltransferase